MSGKKKLERATRNIKVIAFPTRKVERAVTDGNGQPIKDKNGAEVVETTQLYRIKPMR